MHKILLSIALISFSIGTPIIALADAYDDFMKTQMAEFRNADEDKCKNKKIEITEGDRKIAYELCLFRGQPIVLRIRFDGVQADIRHYKRGKLVYVALSEFGDGVGFRNNWPVVEWYSGETTKRRVNWKITAKDRANYLTYVEEDRRILLKFGIGRSTKSSR
jgi:hypothetical protein